MITKNLVLSTLAITLLFSFKSLAYFESCQGFKDDQKNKADFFASRLDVDLLKFPEQEANQVLSGRKATGPGSYVINKVMDFFRSRTNSSPSSIDIKHKLNEIEIKTLLEYRPDDTTDRRLDYITLDLAQKVRDSIERHPVTSSAAAAKYNQKNVEIGFCFGRATYIDLVLARLGVDENSIKKIWAIGPMGEWQFHVGTAVRLNDNSWVVLDNVPRSLLDINNWYKEFRSQARNENVRLYITDSNKFTASLGEYSRLQLGLDLSRARDWYRGYFMDLMAWFKIKNPELAAFLDIEKMPDRPLSATQVLELDKTKKALAEALRATEELEAAEKRAAGYGIDPTVGGE